MNKIFYLRNTGGLHLFLPCMKLSKHTYFIYIYHTLNFSTEIHGCTSIRLSLQVSSATSCVCERERARARAWMHARCVCVVCAHLIYMHVLQLLWEAFSHIAITAQRLSVHIHVCIRRSELEQHDVNKIAPKFQNTSKRVRTLVLSLHICQIQWH